MTLEADGRTREEPQLTHSPPNTPPTRVEISRKSMMWVVLIAAGCWLLIQLAPVVLTVVVALFLMGTLNPLVEWLERKHVRRSWGIPLVFSALLLIGVSLGALTLPSLFSQVQELVQHEPQLRGKTVEWLSQTRVLKPAAQWLRHLDYGALAKGAAGSLWLYSTAAATWIGYLLSAVFLALYMMLDRDRLRGALFASVPRQHHLRLSRVMLNLEVIVGGYIRGQALTSGLMTLFSLILLTACGVPSALALAVFAGIVDVLPYIGVVLAVAPMTLAATSQGVIVTVIVLTVMLAYEEFESRFLIPGIYGRVLRLPSSMVLLALLVGGTLMGIVGALLALPLAASLRMLVEELRVDLPGENVDDSSQRRRDARAEREYEQRTDGAPAVKAAAVAVEISGEQLRKTAERHSG